MKTQAIGKRAALAVVFLALPCCEILAQDDPWEIGARFNAVTAGGEPANDILGFGVFGRYRITDAWLPGFAVDRADYDFERPWKVLGLQQDPAVEVIDAPASATTLSVWAEREHARAGSRLRAKRWVFDFQLRADRHLADWKVRDRNSTATGSIGGYTGLGGSFVLSRRF